MKLKMTLFVFIFLMASVALTACGSGTSNDQADSTSQSNATAKGDDAAAASKTVQPAPSLDTIDEPVEITVSINGMNPENFEKQFVEPAKEKFPNLTLTAVDPRQGATMQNLITTNQIPDILFASKGGIDNHIQYEIFEDISPLIKKYNFDLGGIQPALLDMIKSHSGGELIGLPLFASSYAPALYYNKDLFDQLGVEYPTDGMTWDDVYAVAQKLNTVRDGVQYRGYSDRWHATLLAANPFSLDYLQTDADKSTFNNDQWKVIIDNWKRFYTLPGLVFTTENLNPQPERLVFASGISGMTITPAALETWTFDWDIVSTPVYSTLPNYAAMGNLGASFILRQSKHKDEAFKLIAWMASAEYQEVFARQGSLPILTDKKIQSQYLQDNERYANKNIQAFFRYPYAPDPPARDASLTAGLGGVVQNALMNSMIQMIIDGTDVNTALRLADEQANLEIEKIRNAEAK